MDTANNDHSFAFHACFDGVFPVVPIVSEPSITLKALILSAEFGTVPL